MNGISLHVQLPLSSLTEELWPGRSLNPGLPNNTRALYPLLLELMLNI
jgi:hypothetical protein